MTITSTPSQKPKPARDMELKIWVARAGSGYWRRKHKDPSRKIKKLEERLHETKLWVEPNGVSKKGYFRLKRLEDRKPVARKERLHIVTFLAIGQYWSSLFTDHVVTIVNLYPAKELVTIRYTDGFEATLSYARFKEIFTYGAPL